ncbi:MAG TPA: DUF348 domain-containing protein [Chloroflexi bacterium]|nr:DUF348 domain-containing protein [Chloroflexota bacterium]
MKKQIVAALIKQTKQSFRHCTLNLNARRKTQNKTAASGGPSPFIRRPLLLFAQPLAKQHFALTVLLTLLMLSLLTGCRRSAIPAAVEVDGQSIQLNTNAATVRDLLKEAKVTLGDLDRVDPDLYKSITPGMTVRVIRVTEKTETDTLTIPFERKIVINEALPEGEQRLAQLGVNGEEEIITQITYENGLEVSRTQVSRAVTREAIDEILVVGGEGSLPPAHFDGSIAYLSGGNVWIMKETSEVRRPLTTGGDLDARVFSVSRDGNTLLYSRSVTNITGSPLNELWTVNTRIVGEDPISLPVKGVLYAEFSPISTTLIAYSTARRVTSQPGWKANNDLWLWDTSAPQTEASAVISANTRGLYPWWGTSFKWSPDGKKFAFANASQVGVIDVISKTVTTLKEFAPYNTASEWVWVPTVSWSPDSNFIATVIHGAPIQDERPEASQIFDVWLLAADGSIQAKIRERAGMWSNPVWHAGGITFARAADALHSVKSWYKLITVDWDGSNPRLIFPLDNGVGLEFPEMIWLPNEPTTSVLVHRNNLYLLKEEGNFLQQLTSDNQSHKPLWIIPSNSIIVTAPKILSGTPAITPSALLTTSKPITSMKPVKFGRDKRREHNLID